MREDLSQLVLHRMVAKLLCLEMDHVVGVVSFGAEITVSLPSGLPVQAAEGSLSDPDVPL